MKLIETTVIDVSEVEVDGKIERTATYVEDYPSLAEARAAAKKLGEGYETVPSDIWHLGHYSEWIEQQKRKR